LGVSAETGSGTETYAALIDRELDAQEARKASLEQRGLAVITTAGALTSLLFGLAAFSTTNANAVVLPGSARHLLIAAVVLFFASSVGALVVNAPLIYQAVTPVEIRGRLNEEPVRDSEAAARDIAFTQLKTLESAKKMNGIKGWALLASMVVEAAAVGCLVAAITYVL
jgi:hypothetical protein